MKTVLKNNNRVASKSTDALKEIMNEVLACAHQQGATQAAVTANHDRGFSVDVRMGEVETVAFSEDQGISVSVYVGSCMGTASSSDTSPQALASMVEAAYAIAKVSASDPCFGLPDLSLLSHHYPDLALSYPWEITPEAAIDMALRCEKTALALDSRISNSDGVNVGTYTFCQGYASSQGFMGVVESTRHGISCSLLAEDAKGMQRDYEYSTARNALALVPVEALARSAASRTLARLGARKLKTQKSPVLFSSRLSSGLVGSFVSAISGGALYRKHSFLLDRLGTMVFPENIRIHEQPHLLGALGSSPYDGEGVLTRQNVLVEQGQLCQYVLSSYSARKLGMQTTANSGGVFNLTVEPTAGDADEMLRLLGTGLWVTELMGQGVNLLTGDYSRGASGFWIENGEIQYPVEEITIAGNLNDMFRGIVAVGQDLNPNSATRCGSILIDQMMIAGN